MKILLVDLDGTIRRSTTGKFVESPQGQAAIPEAQKALKFYASRNWQIAGVSNQGGIEAGYKNLESCILEMQFTLELFPELDCIFFCPDFGGRKCVFVDRNKFFCYSLDNIPGWKQAGNISPDISFRKPGAGMLIGAIEKLSGKHHHVFLDSCFWHPEYDIWMIGDRPEDQKAANSLDINFLGAETVIKRFSTSFNTFENLSPPQIKFLEAI